MIMATIIEFMTVLGCIGMGVLMMPITPYAMIAFGYIAAILITVEMIKIGD